MLLIINRYVTNTRFLNIQCDLHPRNLTEFGTRLKKKTKMVLSIAQNHFIYINHKLSLMNKYS